MGFFNCISSCSENLYIGVTQRKPNSSNEDQLNASGTASNKSITVNALAFIISSIPAYYGYHVEGGALEIGRASTTAVVVSCIMILFADYLLAALIL